MGSHGCHPRPRDLKPENILLSANGHALLTDFDLSYCSKGTYPELIKKTPPRKVRCGDAPAGKCRSPARLVASSRARAYNSCFGFQELVVLPVFVC